MSNHHHMHPYSTHQPENSAYQPETAPEDTPPDVALEQPDSEKEPAGPEAEQTVDPATEAQKEIEDMRLRMAAEMENFKKRLAREHQEQMRYASEKVLAGLLPALDNLDLAIQYGSQHEACKDMMQGIEMTRRQLLDAVGQSGLASVGEKGEEFNPAIHEAIGMEADDSVAQGAVARVLQRGYKLHDRLLRPAKVMVNNG